MGPPCENAVPGQKSQDQECTLLHMHPSQPLVQARGMAAAALSCAFTASVLRRIECGGAASLAYRAAARLTVVAATPMKHRSGTGHHSPHCSAASASTCFARHLADGGGSVGRRQSREHQQSVLLAVLLGSVLTSGVCDATDRCTPYSTGTSTLCVRVLESCACVCVHFFRSFYRTLRS